MRSIRHIHPVLRATGVIGVVAVLVTGVTFAVLDNQAVLADNSLVSSSGQLLVKNTDTGATGDFNTINNGFAFAGIVPGSDSSLPHSFQLKNVGTASMAVNVRLQEPPKGPGTFLPAPLDGSEITFTFFDGAFAQVASATWLQLATEDGVQLDTVAAGATNSYNVSVSISGAAGVPSLDLDGFNLVFGTVAVEAPAP